MSAHESLGQSDEWYTPEYVFRAMAAQFDMDVASPPLGVSCPSREWCAEHRSADSLDKPWRGFVWMNPPFGGRNGYRPWADKFIAHGNGVALAPNRTGAKWFADFSRRCEYALFVSPKIKFLRPDGTVGGSPGYGSVLLSIGERGKDALLMAATSGLGVMWQRWV